MIELRAQVIPVGLGEAAVADRELGALIAYGLGSCVAVCLYDPVRRLGGMAHVVLPERNTVTSESYSKYANTAVPYLVDKMLRLGATRYRLIAKIAGGARMLNLWGMNDTFNIGERNVLAVEKALAGERIRLAAADTGGSAGRTVTLCLASGDVLVRTAGSAERVV